MAEKSDHGAHEAVPEVADPGDGSNKAGSHRAGSRFSRIANSDGAALLIEFFKMTRTTAVLLIAFVLTLALYMLVRQDPVVAFNSPPRPDSTQTEPSGSSTTGTDAPTSSDQPVTSTEPSGTLTSTSPSSPTGTSGTEVSPPGRQRGFETGEGQDGDQPQQSPQVSPSPQSPTGQSPQQTQQTQVPVS